MDQILSILKTLVNSNAINFIIMAVLLWAVIKNLHPSEALENSISKIKTRINKAEEEKVASRDILLKNRNLLNRLPEDIENMERTSESKIRAFETKIERNTRKTIADLDRTLNRAKTIEEKKISNLITEKTSKEAIERAKSQIRELLEKNPSLHNEFIEQSLDELDKVTI